MYWETYDGGQIRELEGSQQGSIDGMDISSDGSHFVTGGDDKEVVVRAFVAKCVTKAVARVIIRASANSSKDSANLMVAETGKSD